MSSCFESPDVWTVFVTRGVVLTKPILQDDAVCTSVVDTSGDFVVVIIITVSLAFWCSGALIGFLTGDLSAVIFTTGSFLGVPLALATLTGIKLLFVRSFVLLEVLVVVFVARLACSLSAFLITVTASGFSVGSLTFLERYCRLVLLVTDEDDDLPVRSERSVAVRVYLVLCTSGLGSGFFTALDVDSGLVVSLTAVVPDLLAEVSLEDFTFLSTDDCAAVELER